MWHDGKAKDGQNSKTVMYTGRLDAWISNFQTVSWPRRLFRPAWVLRVPCILDLMPSSNAKKKSPISLITFSLSRFLFWCMNPKNISTLNCAIWTFSKPKDSSGLMPYKIWARPLGTTLRRVNFFSMLTKSKFTFQVLLCVSYSNIMTQNTDRLTDMTRYRQTLSGAWNQIWVVFYSGKYG